MIVYTLEQRWEILRLYYSDEAHFDIGGYVNKQNESLFDADIGPEA